jgi:hypothetical protein
MNDEHTEAPTGSGSVSLPMDDEAHEMIELLKEALDLTSDEAVLRLLMRQAVQRVAITCPTCGHYARRTTEDEARCRSCLSVIKLSEGIWYLDH